MRPFLTHFKPRPSYPSRLRTAIGSEMAREERDSREPCSIPVALFPPVLPVSRARNIDSLPTLCYPHCTRPLIGLPSQSQDETAHSSMTIFRSLITPCSELLGSWSGRITSVLLCAALLFLAPPVVSAKSKPHRAPHPEPELKILDLKVSPSPYTLSSGSLQFSALVQLPKELNGTTLLEFSSFITSPSKNSLRFLTTRTALEPHQALPPGAAPPQVSVLLTWDGLDQKKVPSVAGLYQFEVRAKLLANGEKGPRTQMVAWPKRGTIEVK